MGQQITTLTAGGGELTEADESRRTAAPTATKIGTWAHFGLECVCVEETLLLSPLGHWSQKAMLFIEAHTYSCVLAVFTTLCANLDMKFRLSLSFLSPNLGSLARTF